MDITEFIDRDWDRDAKTYLIVDIVELMVNEPVIDLSEEKSLDVDSDAVRDWDNILIRLDNLDDTALNVR